MGAQAQDHPQGFSSRALGVSDGTGNPHWGREGMSCAAVLQTDRGGPGVPSSAQAALLGPQTHSAVLGLCQCRASVHLPQRLYLWLFEDMVVASLGAWSTTWGLLPLFYLFIEMNSYKLHTNNVLFKPFERKLLT